MSKMKVLFMFFMLACFYAACKSDPPYDRNMQSVIDNDKIIRFLDSLKITAKKTNEGLYYQIIKEGTGAGGIDTLDTVMVHYVGRTLNGKVFDSTATNVDSLATSFRMVQVMEGWRRGIPLVKEGGTIRLIIPSAMGYQNRVFDSIPANSVLDFNIRLIKVKKYKSK